VSITIYTHFKSFSQLVVSLGVYILITAEHIRSGKRKEVIAPYLGPVDPPISGHIA
jgi:hypothetical protein